MWLFIQETIASALTVLYFIHSSIDIQIIQIKRCRINTERITRGHNKEISMKAY